MVVRPGAHGPRARNFHYITGSAIYQAKSCENLHKLFFPILCDPSIDKSLRVCYIIIVPREQKDEVNKMTNYNIHSFIKTQLLYAEQMPCDAEFFKHNAYGAVSWELYRTNDQTLEEQWETVYAPKFDAIIRNYHF
jgi:hypothetical protein